MNNLLKRSVLFMIIVSLLSCGSKKEIVQKDAVIDLSGNWSLKTLNGQDAVSLFKGTIPSMTIDQSKNLISGNGGCNTFTGSYTYDKGRFNVSKLASTLMLCTEENAETELMQILSTESIVKQTDDKLIFYKQGNKVAEFVRAINMALLSGEWILDSLNEEPVLSIFPNGGAPTISFFTADKQISGTTGCNQYNAPFTLNGYALNVGPIITTRMACPGAMQLESDFVQALSNTSNLSLKDNILVLTKDGKEVLKFKKDNE